MRAIIFDCETTGIPEWKLPSDDPSQPRVVEIAAELWEHDENGSTLLDEMHYLVNPGVPISDELVAVHGITNEMVEAEGVTPALALDRFFGMADGVDFHVAHNATFDVRMIRIEGAIVSGIKWDCPKERKFCTMSKSRSFFKKTPTLQEVLAHLWPDEDHPVFHRAKPDMIGARRIYFKLMELKPELFITELV